MRKNRGVVETPKNERARIRKMRPEMELRGGARTGDKEERASSTEKQRTIPYRNRRAPNLERPTLILFHKLHQ